jgi:hypothetical protein
MKHDRNPFPLHGRRYRDIYGGLTTCPGPDTNVCRKARVPEVSPDWEEKPSLPDGLLNTAPETDSAGPGNRPVQLVLRSASDLNSFTLLYIDSIFDLL